MSKAKSINLQTVFSIRSMFFSSIGVVFAILGLQGFMMPNNFVDGGVTGISILILGFINIHISLLLLVLNIPFVTLAYFKISPGFAIQSLIAVIMLAAGMYFIEIRAFTNDKFLIAIFGGFFIGVGIGFVIRGGGIIDGLEVIAQYTEKKSAFSSAEIILLINILVILGAAYRFGIETSMYSILVYYIAMKTTDYVVDGFKEYTSLHIVSKIPEEIKSEIVLNFGKQITTYKGEKGFLPGSFENYDDCEVIMTIVTRLEMHKIKKHLQLIDPSAFIYVNSIKEVAGNNKV